MNSNAQQPPAGAFVSSTMQNYPLTVTAVLRHACIVNGDRTVVTATADGARQTTYRELGDRAAQLANALRRLGIAPGQRVATFMWNNQEHLTAYLAVPAMGAVLHTLNTRLAAEQIAYTANDAEDSVVIVDLSLAAQLSTALSKMNTVHTVIAVGDGAIDVLAASPQTVHRYDEFLGAESTSFDWPPVDENAPAAMCYSSGTTGNPKGVVYSHRSSFLHSMASNTANGMGIGANDCVMPIVPMFHANAWGLPYGAMMAGADLVLPDRFMDSQSLVGLIEAQRPTIAAAVPTIWNDIANYLKQARHYDISSLRRVFCGGSAVSRSLMQTYQECHGIELVQLWGMTETSPLLTVAWPPLPARGDAYWAARISQGRPPCGVEIRVVDGAGEPLPRDGQAVGELQVRGPWVTGSYYKGRDEAQFASGWLRTGDVGMIDTLGYVTVTDRIKDIIKSGGEWISSIDLENHLIAH